LAQKTTFDYNVISGLRQWKATLAKLNSGTSQIFNLSIVGDSISEGYGSTNLISKGYAGLIRNDLNSKYGDVGRGFIHCAYPYGSPLWSFVGSWMTSEWGISGGGTASNYTCKYSLTAGNTATLSFSGTGLRVYIGKSPGWGGGTYSVDGGTVTGSFSNDGTEQYNAYFEVIGLTDGSHTIVITQASQGKAMLLLGAYEIKGTSGIRVNTCARFGSMAKDHTPEKTMKITFDSLQPVLSIIAFTANDYSTQTNLDLYKSNLQALVTRAKQYGDVLMISNGIRTEKLTTPQSAYINVFNSVALANGCALIDNFNRLGGDADYVNTRLGLLSDTVHPNNAGHQDLATSILNVLLEGK
jgi:lysophospholipase L1-like esterase